MMLRELSRFIKLSIPQHQIQQHLEKISRKCESHMKQLHSLNCIDDDMPYRTGGVKLQNGVYRHVQGSSSKYFCNYVPAYAYLLIKTHKLTQDQLQTCSIFDIPVRLLQSAGNICTSRITAFLESLLSPISINYCKTDVNEYCKDSRDYLLRLEEWKKKVPDQLDTGSIFVVAADVIGLYPNLSRNLVKSAVRNALEKHSEFNSSVVKRFSKTYGDISMFFKWRFTPSASCFSLYCVRRVN